MPPKPSFTKEEIIAAALCVVSESGLQGLTALFFWCAAVSLR